jgi:hypothetical protein
MIKTIVYTFFFITQNLISSLHAESLVASLSQKTFEKVIGSSCKESNVEEIQSVELIRGNCTTCQNKPEKKLDEIAQILFFKLVRNTIFEIYET